MNNNEFLEKVWKNFGELGTREDLFSIISTIKSLQDRAWARLETMGDFTESELEFMADTYAGARRFALERLGNTSLINRVMRGNCKDIARDVLKERSLTPDEKMVLLENGYYKLNETEYSEVMYMLAQDLTVPLLQRLCHFCTRQRWTHAEHSEFIPRFISSGNLNADDLAMLVWRNNVPIPLQKEIIPILLKSNPGFDILHSITRRGNHHEQQEASCQLVNRFGTELGADALASLLITIEDVDTQKIAWSELINTRRKSKVLQRIMQYCTSFSHQAWLQLKTQKPTKKSVAGLLVSLERVLNDETKLSMKEYATDARKIK